MNYPDFLIHNTLAPDTTHVTISLVGLGSLLFAPDKKQNLFTFYLPLLKSVKKRNCILFSEFKNSTENSFFSHSRIASVLVKSNLYKIQNQASAQQHSSNYVRAINEGAKFLVPWNIIRCRCSGGQTLMEFFMFSFFHAHGATFIKFGFMWNNSWWLSIAQIDWQLCAVAVHEIRFKHDHIHLRRSFSFPLNGCSYPFEYYRLCGFNISP